MQGPYSELAYRQMAQRDRNIARGDAMRSGNTSGFMQASFSPSMGPAWDGFFQALKENGVDRLADSSVGEARGMWKGTPNKRLVGVDDYDQTAYTPSRQLNQRKAVLNGFSDAVQRF